MSIELNGVQLLQKELMRFGPVVAKKGRDTGIRRAAVHMRRELKAAAPRGKTGELKKNIGFKYSRKSGKAWVGLRPRKARKGYGTQGGVFYYKVLDFGRPDYVRKVRGPMPASGPLRPWFVRAAKAASPEAAQIVIDYTLKGIYQEAGKVYARSKRSNDMKGKFSGRRRRFL